MIELIGISYSPWSERARWALDYQQQPYKYREHVIMLGMPELRLRLRKPVGPLTVPALIDGGVRLTDSLEIAEYADKIGEKEKLFPEALRAEVVRMAQFSETALEAARGMVATRVAWDPEAQAEALPAYVPGPLRGALRGVAQLGIFYLDREFGLSGKSLEDYEADLRQVLVFLREQLGKSGGKHVLGGGFTFADICFATALQGVAPVADEYIRLGPATRRAWTSESLAGEFADLIQWRDEVYRRHRL